MYTVQERKIKREEKLHPRRERLISLTHSADREKDQIRSAYWDRVYLYGFIIMDKVLVPE